jgi:DNA-binding GntR family transcriptional regulator
VPVSEVFLSEGVYDELRQRLRSGSFQPGTRLVNRKIAAELGTSTIPVREAIGRLVSEGLLESTPGAGAFVRTPDPSELSELYDVREVLEVLAAAEAARFITAPLLAELRGLCERFREIATAIPRGKHATRAQFDEWLQCEELFHTRLVSAARNRWLAKVVKDLRVISEVFAAHKTAPQLLTRALADSTLKQHQAFLRILANRQTEKARTWMTAHIRSGRDSVLEHLTTHRARRK